MGMNGSRSLVLTAPVSAACCRPLVLPGCDRDGDARTRKVGHVFNERLIDVDDGKHSKGLSHGPKYKESKADKGL